MRSIGEPVASRIARAASSEITSPNGRILGRRHHQRDSSRTRWPSSGSSSLFIAETDGIFRPGQRHDDLSLRRSGACAAHHRRRPDLLVAEHAEQLAESLEPLFEKVADDFVGGVARRDARAACRDDDMGRRGVELLLNCCPDRFGIVADDRAARHLVAVRLEQLGDRDAAGVVGGCACR